MTPQSRHLTDAEAQRLVDGMLPEQEAPAIERHLAGCAECQASVETYRMLASALDDLDVPPLPADFTASVIDRIEVRERVAARERRLAAVILATVTLAAAAAFAAAGASAWAPLFSSSAEVLGHALVAVRIGGDFVPKIVSALRPQIILAAGALALPLLLALFRLMPAPRAETV